MLKYASHHQKAVLILQLEVRSARSDDTAKSPTPIKRHGSSTKTLCTSPTMSAYASHTYSSPLNPGGASERSRNVLGSPQPNTHGLASTGHGNMNMPSYAYSTNAPSSTSSFGVGNPLNESMSPSRPQYQPGYLLVRSTITAVLVQLAHAPLVPSPEPGTLPTLSPKRCSLTSQKNPQPIARNEETHVIPVRAKMNPAFARSATSDFGTESMFETTKYQAQRLAAIWTCALTSSHIDIIDTRTLMKRMALLPPR